MTGFTGSKAATGMKPNRSEETQEATPMYAISLLACRLAMLPAGPAHAADLSGARIPVIVKATTSQYWATVFDGADAAAKALGVQISKLGATAETDVAGEVSIMENAIATKPTAIVVAATNAAALAAADRASAQRPGSR